MYARTYADTGEKLEMFDDFEEDRLEHLQIAKSRGKGAPKKKKSAAGKY